MPNSWCSATRRDPAPPDQPAPLPAGRQNTSRSVSASVGSSGQISQACRLAGRTPRCSTRSAAAVLRAAGMHPPGFVLTATRDPGPRLRRYALPPARRAPGSWAAQAQASELRGFAKGLHKDWAAITELTTPYSSGAVEGHVNRIKMIPKTDVRAGETRPAPQACPARRLTRHGNWARATAT